MPAGGADNYHLGRRAITRRQTLTTSLAPGTAASLSRFGYVDLTDLRYTKVIGGVSPDVTPSLQWLPAA